MAKAARATPTRCGSSLSEEIVVWEILVRLPPKSLLRFRVVCRAWCRATSSRDFILAHHGQQPTFPLLHAYNKGGNLQSLDIIPFNHQSGLNDADQLQTVAPPDYDYYEVMASCDGLLVLSINDHQFAICNPVTRQYAPLPLLQGFRVLGMYACPGEYRLLLKTSSMYSGHGTPQDGYYHVFTLGSYQPPRSIGCFGKDLIYDFCSIMFRGSLHLHLKKKGSVNNMITIFDTTAESFRQMRGPPVPGCSSLLEIGEMLAMPSFNAAETIIDIWVMQDYEGEVWGFKYRVELPLAELGVHVGRQWSVVVPSWEGDVLLLVKAGEWLLQVDMDGKLLASFHRKGLRPSQHRLKQSLVQHAFFPTLEGYVVNYPTFTVAELCLKQWV